MRNAPSQAEPEPVGYMRSSPVEQQRTRSKPPRTPNRSDKRRRGVVLELEVVDLEALGAQHAAQAMGGGRLVGQG